MKKLFLILILSFFLSGCTTQSEIDLSGDISLKKINKSPQNQKQVLFQTKQIKEIKGGNIKQENVKVNESKGKTYLVTKVIDGDTIQLENGRKVRYIGIDTPETVHPNKPIQCFGKEASNKNKELVYGKRVRLEKDISDRDKYGRLLRYVYVDDIFVNLELVEQGYATVYTYPPDVKYQDKFLAAQRRAIKNNRGLWGICKKGSKERNKKCNIKGNISYKTKEKIYHLPECPYYSQTAINESKGERWFCTEEEALNAGWRKAKNCP